MSIRILHGDCREVLKTLPDCSVASIVTDPPYELGFMGKKWDGSGIAHNVGMWAECLRVLKPGGYLLAFSGTRTQHRMVCAIEDAGFEIRDLIAWVYGSGFPKSLDVSKAIDKAAGVAFDAAPAAGVGFMNAEGAGGYNVTKNQLVRKGDSTDAARQWQGWGTALKPALEPITMARKPLIGTVAENVLQHGTGAVNVDGCRVGNESRPVMVRTATAVSANAMSGSSTGATSNGEVTALGRWPANLIHDGSDEVLGAFPQAPGQLAAAKTDGAPKNLHAYNAMKYEIGREYEPRPFEGGSAARFFYCAKADRADRNEGLYDMDSRQQDEGRKAGNPGGDNPRNRGVNGRQNHHPTVKPTDLMRYLCRLVTPAGGVVLDPFMGSGSTLKAAELEGFSAIGIELDADYIAIAQRRIAADAPLFAEVTA